MCEHSGSCVKKFPVKVSITMYLKALAHLCFLMEPGCVALHGKWLVRPGCLFCLEALQPCQQQAYLMLGVDVFEGRQPFTRTVEGNLIVRPLHSHIASWVRL